MRVSFEWWGIFFCRGELSIRLSESSRVKSSIINERKRHTHAFLYIKVEVVSVRLILKASTINHYSSISYDSPAS
jgi:hypothetical protein